MALRTKEDTAQRLGVPVGTLNTWRFLGKGPKFVKLEGLVRYADEDIDAYIAEMRRSSTPQTRRPRQQVA